MTALQLTPMELDLFGTDPWWITVIKGAVLLVYLLLFTLFNIVFERKVVAKMQHRAGPKMNGPGGWGQSLADGMKLMLKEDVRPKAAEKFVFNLAPYLVAIPAFSVLSVIPFGGEVTIFGVRTTLQMTDMPVSALFILALASVGIYGIVLAGWSSGSTYALLGGLRSSAQMISYEIAMGLSLVGVFLYAGTMSTSEIVEAQTRPIEFFGMATLPIPGVYAILLLPSFLIFWISMVGETNRAPFDLPEAESELVGGFHTEYSGFRFAMFFLAEYINMVNVSAVAATLFLGGWHAPWPLSMIPALDNPWLGPVWLTLKIVVFMFFFIWLRGTLPRFRYDQFMNLGWKYLIPISLVWIVAIGGIRAFVGNAPMPVIFGVLAAICVIVLLVLFAGEAREKKREQALAAEAERKAAEPFDPYAGGYPVPPKEGQRLPEMAEVVPGEVGESPRRAASGDAATDHSATDHNVKESDS